MKAKLRLDLDTIAHYQRHYPAAKTDDHLRIVDLMYHLFKGLHHAPYKVQFINGHDGDGAVFSVYGDLSTIDDDKLTRLVIMAHTYCIRVTIKSSGPRMVKLMLWCRQTRVGSITALHPQLRNVGFRTPAWDTPPEGEEPHNNLNPDAFPPLRADS